MKDNKTNPADFTGNILLIGFMGAGKTTVATCLGEMCGFDVAEMDSLIAQKERMTIGEIFKTYGEEYFRDRETDMLIELQNRERTVISCGGGVVTRDENLTHMKQTGTVVLLTALPETVYERIAHSDERPLLKNNMSVSYIRELMEKRSARYYEAADLVIDTDGKTSLDICEELLRRLGIA